MGQWIEYYNSKLWKIRRKQQLERQPLCARCLQENRIVPASIAHHTIPHRGNWKIFISARLESLCKSCHDGIIQSIEVRGYDKSIGIDGWSVETSKKPGG